MRKSKYNKPIEKFKNMHEGESAILFATGPSLEQYKPFENSEESLKFGLNRIYTYPEILKTLDYYHFGSHYYLDKAHRKQIDKICNDCEFVKFASA